MGTRDLLFCSYCSKSQKQVGRLIAWQGSYICDVCFDLYNMTAKRKLLKPADIVEALPVDQVRPDDGARARTRIADRRSPSGVVTVSRREAKNGSWQRIAVKTPPERPWSAASSSGPA